jgi:ribosomal-protein-alanine N-acetyltransferase
MNIVVHGNYRRHGIGSSLLAAIFEMGGYLGCSGIRLIAKLTDEAAISFYTGMGFSNTGKKERYYSDGSDGIGMERSLEDERQWWIRRARI